MAEKPTYQELEQRIKELEEESVRRKQTEKSLKESEEKFRQMFETMNNGVAVYEAVDDGRDFIFKDFNAAGERIEDVKREAIIGKRVTTVFPGVEEFGLLDVFKRVWQTGKAENHPISFYKDDRLTGWRENFVYKLPSGEVVAIYEDITDRKRAEEALKESEKRYRSFIVNFHGIAYRGSIKTWKPIFFHGAVEKIAGYTEEEFIAGNPSWYELIHPDDISELKGKDEIYSVPGFSTEREYRIRSKDGEIRWVYESIKNICDESGEPKFVEGAIYDITKQKQIKEALRKSEEKYRSFFEDSSISLWEEDFSAVIEYLNGLRDSGVKDMGSYFDDHPEEIAKCASLARILDVNPATIEMYEAQSKEDLIRNLNNVFTEESLEVFKEQLLTFYKGSTLFESDAITQTIKGKKNHIRLVVSLLSKNKVLVSITDITEHKRVEKALRESEEKYRSMMESMKDEAYICSSDFRIQYMNPATVGRIGRDATGELCYRAIYGLDEECSWCIFDKIFQGENVEYELLNPNNNRYYSISNSPIRHIDGSISKLTVCRDITDVKKMELQLQQAHKMEAIGTLAGGIAHQFNNVLSVIISSIDLFEMDFPGDETIASYTKVMKSSAHRMTQLTAQLLAYARGGKYQAKTVSLSNFVRETLPLVKHISGSAIDVDTDLPRGIFNVKADLTQMQMVLSAVLTNASEAMEGKGRIRVACKDTVITDETVGDSPGLTPGNYVNLTIVDDGKGMDEETRARIFEPFFTTKFMGRGLGMAAAFGIVKNHDGWISVESEPGKGTVVQIYLPEVEVPVKKHAKPEPKAEWVKGTGTILVIEDEEPVMEISRAILERLGYRVLVAGTGQEAIDVVKTFDGHIDLALLDILLPDMSGNDIYPLIMAARPDLKVIVFSGYSMDGPVREILNAGAEDFIKKPFTIAELSEKLKKTIEGGQ